MRYYIGLDNGGTTTKAAIFSQDGREIGVASILTATITPKPGYVERDMEEMWHANCSVISQVLQKTGVSADDIAGVGVCGHGKGLYLWGKDDKPAYHGITSSDNRAVEYAVRWTHDDTEKKAFTISCQHVLACQPVALLAWMIDHEPLVVENIKWIFECKDYIRFRLTGEAWAEITDYSGTNLLNLRTREYDRQLLCLFGIEKLWNTLPPLCQSTDRCGSITPEASARCGLKAGTPVFAGMFDINACALATKVIDETYMCMIAGTWSINEYLSKTPVTDGRVLMNSIFCLPDYFLIEESSATSAGNNEWFIQQLLLEVALAAKNNGAKIYDMMDEWVSSISHKEFIPIFLPFLMGSNVHPNARASFVGINANHTRKHLVRSVYEGIAFSHRYHYEKLLDTREKAPIGIRLAGGVAHSQIWTQMFSDIMQYPIETIHVNETGALGCAMSVAYALGDYSSLPDAVNGMSNIAEKFEPNQALESVYDKKYKLYLKTIECLDGLWDLMKTMT